MKTMIVAAAVIGLAGCTGIYGNVTPKENGVYDVVTTSDTGQHAMRMALISAETICTKKQMRHIVTDQSTKYVGQFANEAARDQANGMLAGMALGAGRKTYQPVNGSDDYRATVTFHCGK